MVYSPRLLSELILISSGSGVSMVLKMSTLELLNECKEDCQSGNPDYMLSLPGNRRGNSGLSCWTFGSAREVQTQRNFKG